MSEAESTDRSDPGVTHREDVTLERRVRTLTNPAKEIYHETILNYKKKLSKLTDNLESKLQQSYASTHEPETRAMLKWHIEKACADYRDVSEDYVNYLKRKNTDDSLRELSVHKSEETILIRATAVLDDIAKSLATPTTVKKTSSRKSSRSLTTGDSNTSSILLRKRAKAEAAKARLAFIEQKAELQREMTVLEAKCEVAVAEAELKGVHDKIEEFNNEDGGEEEKQSGPDVTANERAHQYVQQQSYIQVSKPSESFQDRTNLPIDKMNDLKFTDKQRPGISTLHGNLVEDTSRNPLEDLSRYFMRKELVTSRISKFDDKPENYISWKYTFRNVMDELGVNAAEELDLLIKWLGPESTKHAQSLKISNATNPPRALSKVWARLQERYGSAEMIESAIKQKLANFPKVTHRDRKRLYVLSDILSEVQSLKENPQYTQLLSYFDTSSGIIPVVNKLTTDLQNKWRDRATRYKRTHNVTFPPFHYFVDFIHEMASMFNDPGFTSELETSRNDRNVRNQTTGTGVMAKKTNFDDANEKSSVGRCIIHKANHPLSECRAFKQLSIQNRRKLLKDNRICYKCCNSDKHRSRQCPENVNCNVCKSESHVTAMHFVPETSNDKSIPEQNDGGENTSPNTQSVNNKCTEVCQGDFKGKSCAKILLVTVSHSAHPERKFRTYAILDEQSNRTLAQKELFDFFDIHCEEQEYTLSSCAGHTSMSGRRSGGFSVESLDGTYLLNLPTLIECSEIPNDRSEIPTTDVALHHKHLRPIAHEIPPLDQESHISLLIGRDVPEAHHILDQIVGPPSKPYAQKLRFGWVVVGDVCLQGGHVPDTVSVRKTHILKEGRASILQPCTSKLEVLDDHKTNCYHTKGDTFASNIFQQTKNDDKVGLSCEDKIFLEIMDNEFHKDSDGNWCAPLPFKLTRKRLPNNRQVALRRALSLEKSLNKDSMKREHFLAFMKKLLANKHAELAPDLQEGEETWYLPLFGVYHPKKPDQIRCVFDSSAAYNGVSLNDVMLSGPDLINNLVSVLMRFRKEPVAVMADIQQMFYCFSVREDHRNFLRFLWYKDNDMANDLVEYRMRVHVFGNCTSPAVAAYGLRKSADEAASQFGSDVKDFIQRHFYVDDALISVSSSEEAISLLQRSQEALKTHGNLRLHKFASNSEVVMSALSQEDLAKDLKDLHFDSDHLPLQRSLGLHWDLVADSFTFRISTVEKEYTRRGILSTVHSIFDPLGFIAPVTIQGKLILRKVTSDSVGWDQPLAIDSLSEWEQWRNSLESLNSLNIPRMYVLYSLQKAVTKELHIFADASEKAIAAVAYIKTICDNGESSIGFLFGKTKVAPTHGHTIPRLELCAAVLAVEIKDFIVDNLDISFDTVNLYSDSKVVLGYINNQTRRFYIYVGNRVERIRKSSDVSQWKYVPTDKNPADEGTRSVPANQMTNSTWLNGPTDFLKVTGMVTNHDDDEIHELINPENDTEIRPAETIRVTKTSVSGNLSLDTNRYERFSCWRRLVQAIARLKIFARRYNSSQDTVSSVLANEVSSYQDAELFVIKSVQRETYGSEISCIQQNMSLPKDSTIRSLSPYLDANGILRVGGRTKMSDLSTAEKTPLLLPGKHHVSKLLVLHFHEEVKHQGRTFTEGAVRSAGYWITGCKNLISSILHKCVTCRKLRGHLDWQKMADLPKDRLEVAPPFTNVGVDTFGPWTIVSRRTRAVSASSKRWAILFTCLVTRAIHIEVIDEMSSGAFINALRRFTSIRGKVKIFRSDRGTNFIGATDDLHIDSIKVEEGPIKTYLYHSGTVWIFNPPHASHMGGAWERMIGVTRKILDSMLANVSDRNLTHDVLCTFMAEVCAIVNSRPLIPISSDADAPFILSPATILTQKTGDNIDYDNSENQLSAKDLYKSSWRKVKALSDTFWARWRKEYLVTLQKRRKWTDDHRNFSPGDVVLLRDKTVPRNQWPLGVVFRIFPSVDKRVRNVEVRVVKAGKPTLYTRPINEMVLLFSE